MGKLRLIGFIVLVISIAPFAVFAESAGLMASVSEEKRGVLTSRSF
jgi:hypothetical protein